jgi:hypothetical protein
MQVTAGAATGRLAAADEVGQHDAGQRRNLRERIAGIGSAASGSRFGSNVSGGFWSQHPQSLPGTMSGKRERYAAGFGPALAFKFAVLPPAPGQPELSR